MPVLLYMSSKTFLHRNIPMMLMFGDGVKVVHCLLNGINPQFCWYYNRGFGFSSKGSQKFSWLNNLYTISTHNIHLILYHNASSLISSNQTIFLLGKHPSSLLITRKLGSTHPAKNLRSKVYISALILFRLSSNYNQNYKLC